jgi:RnfABCDGE-type electron transport complex B subunit
MDEAIRGLLVLGSVGFIFSIVLALLGKRLKVEEDPLVTQILELLPGLNCGACGFSGCKAFARSLVSNRTLILCRPAGEEVSKRIAALLNLEMKEATSLKAVVRCGADLNQKKNSGEYSGPQSCIFANIVGAALDCKYGCLGFGDCVEICPTKAISMDNKKVYIDIKKCIGCGRCSKACPRNLFELLSYKEGESIYFVACSNKEKTSFVRRVCKRGCIACGLCTRVEDSPFYLKDNLSYLNYQKATSPDVLDKAKKACPTHCIDKVEA